MKKRFLYTILGLLLCISLSTANAAPMYYTFEGTVTGIDQNSGLDLITGRINVGDSIEMVWIIDIDADGYFISNNGSTTVFVDESYVDFFYTDYISGPNLSPPDPGNFDSPKDIAEAHFGWYDSSGVFGPDDFTILYAESGNNFISLRKSEPIGDWEVGMTDFRVDQTLWPPGTFNIEVDIWGSNNLVLTSIREVSTDPPPVPEPATMLLFGLGLLGLAGVNRKRK